jgi:ankyrin repeat protein
MIFGLFGGDKKRVAELISAARSGDIAKIEQLLSKGVDINAPEPESGDTPILAAIDNSQWAAVELLLKHHPDLDLQDKKGISPLYFVVSQGDSSLPRVKQLLEAGASPDVGPSHGDNTGATPLHIAAATGANGCLESLLRHGASATKQIPSGATPLHTAAIGGDQRTIDLLCAAGASVSALNNDKRTPLHNCGITGNAKVAAALIQQGSAVDGDDAEGWTPLMRAVMNNHVEVAKVLLDGGADPDVMVRTDVTTFFPLLVAAMNGFDEMIRILLDKGANAGVHIDGEPSLADAAKHSGNETAVKLLAAALKLHRAADKARKADKAVGKLWQDLVLALNGAKGDEIRQLASAPNFSKLSPDQQLVVQSMLGATEKVRTLLSLGANPNVSFDGVFFGAPVLYVSAGRESSTDVVALLLDAGADAHLTQEDGSTALHVAAKRGNVGIAKLLMGKGVDPNVTYGSGVPPLIDACIQGNTRMVDALIDGGANVNAVLELGYCAFAAAVDNKRMKLAEHLLERGAIPNFGDVDTLPLAVAEHGGMSLIKAIESRGGSIIRPDMLARVAFVAARNKDEAVLDHVLNNGADLGYNNDLKYSPLILASLANHLSLVGRCLARGDDPNLQDVDGETALSLAIEKDHREVIDILRVHRAQVIDYPELTQSDGMLRAAMEGALGTILNLHDAGISINIEDSAGNTPLLIAAQNGHVGVVRSLYHLGADINHKNQDGLSASNLAKKANQEKVLKTLMEFGADDATQEVYGFSSKDESRGAQRTIDMGDAVTGRYSHPFKRNLPYDESEDSDDTLEDVESDDTDDDVSAEESSPVVSEDISEMLSRFEVLLQQPHIIEKVAAGDREIITARIKLVWAKGEGAIPPAQLEELGNLCGFLESQPETEAPTPPLFEAATEGDLKSFRKLVKGGAKVSETLPDGTTLLMTASQNGHDAIVKELIALEVDVNQRQSESFTALIFAAILGHESIVKLLVASGADVNMGHSMPSSKGASGGQTALTVASQRKNLSMCKLLIKLGADANAVTEAGYTPLMWSLVNAEDGNCAKLLLQAGANPDPDAVPVVSFATLTSPLILAATNGATDIVKELIRRKVRVDKPDGDGCTALKHAASSGHADVVAALVKAGASVDVTDHEGWSPLMNAAGHGQLEICTILIKAGANVKAVANSGVTALSQATGSRADGMALNALQNLKNIVSQEDSGEDDDEEGETSDVAVDSFKLASLLLKQGANPNVERDGTPLLEHAIDDGDEDLVKLLKEYGATESASHVGGDAATVAQPESEEGKAFLAAAMHADSKGLLDQVLAGVDLNYSGAQGQTALGLLLAGLQDESNSRIFRRNAEQCLDYLLSHGANPSIGDPSPFVLAAMGRRLHMVQAMIAAGVDINKSIGEGQTALFMSLLAPDAGQPVDDRCAIALLKAGADSSLRHESGAMPIHLAAGCNYLSALQALLERRPQDVDAQTNIGITPLMMAATEGHPDAVKLLLKFGANPGIKDQEGVTAKEVAIKNGNGQLAQMLS